MSAGPRRVVAGLDKAGRSCILIDDRRPIPLPGAQYIWRTSGPLADNSGQEDTGAGPFDPEAVRQREGSGFAIFHFDPADGMLDIGMHATDTIDYIVVLRGRIEFITETGTVELQAGDILVDRGVAHGWRAVGTEPAMTAVVMLPAKPLGNGATIRPPRLATPARPRPKRWRQRARSPSPRG